jgi:NAD(P)H-nitrite reductase large subunit
MEQSNFDEDDEIICNCFQVTEGVIRDYIAENDVTDIKEVTSGCEAGGNCQTCHILIQLFIDENQQEKTLAQGQESTLIETPDKKLGFFSRLFSKS